jgi:response regulator RpfG family c-di-GMP phosphodiesterase
MACLATGRKLCTESGEAMSEDLRILFVDDDPNILQGYQRQLRKSFSLDTAIGPLAGLKALEESGPYSVVVSDMRMPEMTGVEFLIKVREQWPDTVRMMLTGNSDQQTAMDAVNTGHVFRFLTKPCPAETMSPALNAAMAQYRLVRAERELLSKTLGGSISLMTEVLSMINPAAFGRVSRIRRLVGEICKRIKVANSWELSSAAMLCLVGCISVPDKVLGKLQAGESLTAEEEAVFLAHPAIGRRLVSQIPRLQRVADIIGRQEDPWRPASGAENDPDSLRLEANVLKAAIDFDLRTSRGESNETALASLEAHPELYCPSVVAALTQAFEVSRDARMVMVNGLKDGMILDEPVLTLKGDLLVAKGTEIVTLVRERLASFVGSARGIREPIRVLCASGMSLPTESPTE